MTWWWLSSKRMTVEVGLDVNDRVKTCPPIVRVFKGQHIDNLRGWMARQEGYLEHRHEV